MRGLRLFERFGFQRGSLQKGKSSSKRVFEYDTYKYFPHIFDWIREQTGETLTKYTPTSELLNLLNNRMIRNIE